MRKFSSLESMEDDEFMQGRKGIFPWVEPGDYIILDGWKLTVTQGAKDCDCGKGMYCPYIIQERV